MQKPPMSDKICLITGANSGIGKVTALELAKMGAHIIMVCRDQEKGEKAQREIKTESGNENVDLLLANLASLQEVRQLATRVKEQYTHLNVLINNAGAYFMRRTLSPDGFEMTLAINHLSAFLLTHELLDLLQQSMPSRIINVNSDAHYSARTFDVNDMQMEKQYRQFGFQAYARSKLANMFFTYELAERLVDTDITVNALHPGMVYTNIWSTSLPKPLRFLGVLGKLFTIPAEEGAQTSIYLASSPEVEKVSGKFFIKSAPVHSSRLSYDEQLRKQVWELTEKMVGTQEE